MYMNTFAGEVNKHESVGLRIFESIDYQGFLTIIYSRTTGRESIIESIFIFSSLIVLNRDIATLRIIM